MRKILRIAVLAAAFLLPYLGLYSQVPSALDSGEVRELGNQWFVNLAIDENYEFIGRTVTLKSIQADSATVEVSGTTITLGLARRVLPSVVNGVRIYLCDTKLMANYTVPGPYGTRNGVTKDALICLSDPAKPLLDPERFVFPIDRRDGFEWSMAENSHTYAFLHSGRQHEGTDISLMDGKVSPVHSLVAVEDATVTWVRPHSGEQACICLESTSTPGVYYLYQHMEAETVTVKAGDLVSKAQKLGYIWGDNSWGHLHFGVIGWGEEPVFETRYGNSIPAFAMLYELWNGDLEARHKTWSWGMWSFARHRASVENIKRQNAFDEKLGYGWLLGDWCPAKKVEPVEGKDQFSSALLRKSLFAGTVSEATNPLNYFDFEITVPNGNYAVNLLLGDVIQPTWQRVEIEGIDAGSFELPPNTLAWTGEKRTRVDDERLTVRIHLKDAETYAALSEISFHFRDRRPL